jgi:hypothetical protein
LLAFCDDRPWRFFLFLWSNTISFASLLTRTVNTLVSDEPLQRRRLSTNQARDVQVGGGAQPLHARAQPRLLLQSRGVWQVHFGRARGKLPDLEQGRPGRPGGQDARAGVGQPVRVHCLFPLAQPSASD